MFRDLNRPLIYSLLTHVLVVLFFTLKAAFFSTPMDSYEPALRVDIVDLPDKHQGIAAPPVSQPILPEKQKDGSIGTPPPPLKSPETSDLVLAKDKKKSQNTEISAAESIKNFKKQMAIDKIKAEVQAQARDELAQRVSQFKGNVLSPGTELRGVNKLQHDNYLGDLDRHVKRFWHLPEWLARGNYTAQVRVFIDDQGFLLNAEVSRTSGNAGYDEMVLETVKKAAPFPLPPDKFRAIVSVKGLLLGFPE